MAWQFQLWWFRRSSRGSLECSERPSVGVHFVGRPRTPDTRLRKPCCSVKPVRHISMFGPTLPGMSLVSMYGLGVYTPALPDVCVVARSSSVLMQAILLFVFTSYPQRAPTQQPPRGFSKLVEALRLSPSAACCCVASYHRCRARGPISRWWVPWPRLPRSYYHDQRTALIALCLTGPMQRPSLHGLSLVHESGASAHTARSRSTSGIV